MLIETLSTFPGMFDAVMGESMMKIARKKGILDFKAYDLRDWAHDRHRTTDDEPFGGGCGLVMKCEPIFEAIGAIAAGYKSSGCDTPSTVAVSAHPQAHKPRVVFMAPHGRRLDDSYVCELAGYERLLFVCGHYEGIDERAYALADEIVSIGDYVLTSGELASMVVIDAVVRKLDGVLGAKGGAADESFVDGLLEYPQYTRPSSFHGMEVPEVLLSGDHGAVHSWRRRQSLQRTARLRPDLIEAKRRSQDLDAADLKYLESLADDRAEEQEALS